MRRPPPPPPPCFLGLFLLFFLFLLPFSTATPPNFVVVFLDDAGWGDAGCNAPDQTQETKHLDALATQGLRFTDFHSAASVCTPSRASLLTGRLGLRTGVTNNFRQGSLAGLPQTEVTVAELLRDEAGYTNAMIGKWHLGTHPPFHPTYRGFERYLGVPYSVDMGCTNVPGADHPTRQECCPAHWAAASGGRQGQGQVQDDRHRFAEIDPTSWGFLSHHHHAALRSTAAPQSPTCLAALAVPLYNSSAYMCSGRPSCNDDIVEQPVNLTTLAGRYGAYAEAFLEEMAQQQATAQTRAPFFLYVAMAHMHVPLAYDARFENASSRTDRRIYGNALAEMDHEVGRIVDALNRTGLANDTLLLVTSDNGPWDMKCDYAGLTGPYTGRYIVENHGAASGKFTTWEGGHRVPTVAYWPSHIAPGGVSGALSSTLDIFPTLAALANVSLPRNRSYDGVDLSGVLLESTNGPSGHDVLFHPDQFGQLSAMRLGKYKVHFRLTQAPPCVPDDTRDVDEVLKDWEFVLEDTSAAQGWLRVPLVFDLEADPQEAHPVPVSEEDLVHLRGLWQKKMDDINSTFKSTVDYAQRNDPKGWPCCDAASSSCSCANEDVAGRNSEGEGGGGSKLAAAASWGTA